MSDTPVTLAAIAGAHGIAGEVRLKLFAASADSLKGHGQVQVGGRMLTLTSVRTGAMPIARFAEISTRDDAEGLRGQVLTVSRDSLPPLEEGEYYYADLIGLPCVDGEGGPLGTVAAVENFGAGDLLEVERPDGKRALVPFRAGIADLIGKTISIDKEFLA